MAKISKAGNENSKDPAPLYSSKRFEDSENVDPVPCADGKDEIPSYLASPPIPPENSGPLIPSYCRVLQAGDVASKISYCVSDRGGGPNTIVALSRPKSTSSLKPSGLGQDNLPELLEIGQASLPAAISALTSLLAILLVLIRALVELRKN
jgi:hypothetical protein